MAGTPLSTPPSPHSPTTATANLLDDVFSSSPPSRTVPSDISRLHSTHVTAGYRAGISTSKTSSLQPGFDEGYSLGAIFGLRVGRILGTLEGIWAAQANHDERKRLQSYVSQARNDLAIEKVFAKQYWDHNGVWSYQVVTKAGADEPSFDEIVDQHPVLSKWNGIVEEELAKTGIHLERYAGNDWEAGRLQDEID